MLLFQLLVRSILIAELAKQAHFPEVQFCNPQGRKSWGKIVAYGQPRERNIQLDWNSFSGNLTTTNCASFKGDESKVETVAWE